MNFLSDSRESIAGNLTNRVATAALLESHQLPNLIERKPQILRPFDESNSVNGGGWIAAHAARTVWDRQQTPALVIAYGFDPDFGRSGEPSNGYSDFVGFDGGKATVRSAIVLDMA